MGSDKTTEPDRGFAVTVEGGGESRVPVGGIGTAKAWQEMINGNDDPGMVLLFADRLAAKINSVTPPSANGNSVQIDISRVELMFAALNKHCDLVGDDNKRVQVILDAIENGSVFELIQIGKFMLDNQHLCPSSNRLTQLAKIIFDKLASIKEIGEISDNVALRTSKHGW